MATKKLASPAQIAARKAFAERARSGGFARRKKVATSGAKVKRRASKAPSPAQLRARAKFVAMVRARARGKRGNSGEKSRLEQEVAQASAALRIFPKGRMGLTSDSVKSSREYQAAKARYAKAFAALRKFNAGRRRNVAGDSSVKSPTRTSSDVRSPTRTATSTEAQTSGNVTVTGGAGRGATTRVSIHTAAPRGAKAKVGKKKNGRGFSSGAPGWTRSKRAKRNGVLLTNGFKVSDYSFKVGGRHVRKATQVTTPTGKIVKFTEKLPRAKAIKQAQSYLKKNPTNPMFDVWGSKVSKKSGLARGKSRKLGQVKAWTERGARRKAKRGLGGSFSFNVIGTKKSARYVRRHKKKGGVLGRLFNPAQRAALRKVAQRYNPGKIRFSEADLAKYAPKIKGLSLVGGGSRASAPAKRKKKAARFGKPAKRAMARAFSGSGFLGLGKSRKTVRANTGKRAKEYARIVGRPSTAKKAAKYLRASKRFEGGWAPKGTKRQRTGFKARKTMRRLLNPSPASVFSEFRGKDVASKSKATFHGNATGPVAQLGALRELKLTGKKLEFGGRAVLCADGRKKLHIGGVRFKATGVEEDMGEVRSVTYRSDKPHIESGVLDYVHKFAEDNGKCPHLIVDAEGYPFLEGGSYKISEDGIIN